jgi:DNA-binding LacI/PurR family transcriptional regulator
VRPETRLRVEEAVRVLEYRPDHIARALVTRSSDTIGLLLPSSGDSYWGEIAAGIEERASEAGLSVLFANAHGNADREMAMIELFRAKRVDGIIIAGATGEPGTWFGRRGPDVPVVLVNSDARVRPGDLEAAQVLTPEVFLASIAGQMDATVAGFSHIAFDDVGAARLAVQHLLDLGHEALAFVGGEAIRPAVLRILGFRLALLQAGLSPVRVETSAQTLEGGRLAATELLSNRVRPTAVVAYSDVVAIAVIRAAHVLGLRTPEDVSVIGFDDIDVAAFVEPPLSTIRQPKRSMGRQAMDALLEALAGASQPRRLTIEGELVARSSTGPAKTSPVGATTNVADRHRWEGSR